MRIADEVVEVLFYFDVHLSLGLSFSGEEVIELKNGNDVPSMFLADMLYKKLHLQHTSDCHLETSACHVVEGANHEH